MLLTCIIALLSIDMQAKDSVPEPRISLVQTTAPLRQILKEIENQTEFRFFYNHQQIDARKRISVQFEEATLIQALEQLFKNTTVSYKISDKQVLLYDPAKDLSHPSASTGLNPFGLVAEVTVSGQVTAPSGETMPGVNVLEKGTSNGTTTDIDGRYNLSVTSEDAELVFSFIGYVTQTVSLNNRTVINVTLEEDVKNLEEVVVVGYGTQKKVNLTGAVSPVSGDEITNISSSNLSNTLAGRAPGVNITNTSGLAGASSEIRIRGSFGEPLFVIDGIVRDKQAFDALQANEIDQISFLKDAATASIYGSRAGNGVVLVTTKQGVAQKPTFNFQTMYSFAKPTQTLLSDMTTATDELIYQNRVAEYLGTTPPNGPEEFEYFANRSYNVNDMIWRTPNSQTYNLSVTGGSDKITYYSLLSYRDEEGSFISLDHGKFNLRSNVTAQITESIKMTLNLSAYQVNHNRFYWPFSPDDDYDVSDLYRVTFNWPKTYPFYVEADGTPADYVTDYPVQTPMGSWQAWSVIDQIVGDRYIRTRKRDVNSILALDVNLGKFIPGLSAKVSGNYLARDYMRKRYLTFQKNYVFNQADPDGNRYLPAPPDENKTNTFTFSRNQPFLSYELKNGWSYQVNAFLNYNRTFDKHGINGMVVYEQAEGGVFGAYAQAEDPITSYDQDFAYSTDAERRYGHGWEDYRWENDDDIVARQSLIGRLNYNFDERYIAEFSFRYDGNPLFPEHTRWGFFPSMSAGWRISEEAFMEDNTWFDELKVRASVGTTGNDLDVNNWKINPFSFTPVYSNAGTYIFGNELYRAIAPGATPNPNLTWATSTTYNAGADIAVMQGKLSGSIDFFLKKEVDILGSRLVTLPDNYGQALAPENYAERSWRGGELSVMWQDHAFNSKVKYSVYGNAGYARDQWDVIDEDPIFGPDGNRHSESRIGRPHDRIFGLNTVGMVRTQEQLDALLEQGFKQYGRDPYLGGLIFEDIRGDGYAPGPDGKIDGNDIQLLSDNAKPRLNYGFGFNLEWNNFTMNAHFQGVGVYDRIISNQEGPGMRQHGGSVRPYYPIWAGDVWTPENPDAKYPRPIGKNWAESGTNASSFWIRNGAYLRLKNLNVGYRLPNNWVQTVGLTSAQFFFNGYNIFSIADVKEFHDPEQKNYDSYPVMRSYTLGLDLKF